MFLQIRSVKNIEIRALEKGFCKIYVDEEYQNKKDYVQDIPTMYCEYQKQLQR
jgi:membrane fusion protein (multidrug efflux system)